MRRCKNCGAALAPHAVQCDLCGARAAGPPPVRLEEGPHRRSEGASPGIAPGAPRWVGVAYNLIAAYWLVTGGIRVVAAASGGPGAGGVVAGAFGLLAALIGLGLLLRVEFVRGIVNVLCGLQILFGALGVLDSFLGGDPLGLILSFVQIATAGFMIYLIGETETGPPSF